MPCLNTTFSAKKRILENQRYTVTIPNRKEKGHPFSRKASIFLV